MKDKICCCSERFVIKADDFSTTRSPDFYGLLNFIHKEPVEV